ncbi:MAG: AMP-binding protein [Alphaproteobacteria bacterium]|jgi:fatty-acyl-CoA synthase|nr:AMP-binding protein [Alphaproteobacteria bacterium]MDP6623861.1 AMP-binding protein [Alphaproteobacteria bacterium]|tara:strand:- start:1297 stop:2895 length:1599 start_codon:yes stop_codon:yes gene_type:complete
MTAPSTLANLITAQPAAAPALLDRGRTLSYGELDAMARRLATGLADLGLKRGDRLALWLPNVPAWLGLMLACARLGVIVVSVNTRFRSVEVADIISRSGARVLVLWPGFKDIDFVAMLGEIGERLAAVEAMVLYDETDDTDPEVLARLDAIPGERDLLRYQDLDSNLPYAGDAEPDDGCAIFTTSGTTRAPKFVLHSQRGVVEHARIVAPAVGFTAADAMTLMALPLCGVFGFGLAMVTLAAGRPIVLMTAFDPVAAGRLVREHAITHMYGSDDLFHQILQAAPERSFASLRLCGFASFNAALTDFVPEADRQDMTCAGVYGSSELQALITCQPLDGPATVRAQGGGYVLDSATEVRVCDADSGEELAVGEAGELQFKGIAVFKEYFGDTEATAAAFTEDGFFRTGDLGRLEPDGRVIFISRIGDVLRLGGFLTSPAEIEGHVENHPDIGECKVVGISTPAGNRAVAFVVPRGGTEVDEAALTAHCHAGIAKYKVPVRFFAVEEFPYSVSPNGVKLRRGELRDRALERMGLT